MKKKFNRNDSRQRPKISTGRQPLPKNTELFSRLLVNVKSSDTARKQNIIRRPAFIWGKYFDERNNLVAIDCVFPSAHDPDWKYTNNLHLAGKHFKGLGEKTKYINQKTFFFKNTTDNIGRLQQEHLPHELLPDLILRRACALLDSKEPLSKQYGKSARNLKRVGIVFNAISQGDIQNNSFAPETHDADLKKNQPYEIPGYLTQDHINSICMIAKNYWTFCVKHKLPIIWPEIGAWPHWPEEFKKFVAPQKDFVSLDWWNNSHEPP